MRLGWAACFVVFGIAAACSDFKSGSSGNGNGGDGGSGNGDGGTMGDDSGGGGSDSGGQGGDSGGGGGDSGSGQATGPGPWGALPTGYCCTSNDDCRHRNCIDTGGGIKMCSDDCDADPACQGGLPGFHCTGGMFNGTCTPITMGMACVPASQYTHGTKGLGACCTATHDVSAGTDCIGGLCDSFGSTNNPYICTMVCTKPSDCPGNYECANVGNYNICAQLSDPYTCQ